MSGADSTERLPIRIDTQQATGGGAEKNLFTMQGAVTAETMKLCRWLKPKLLAQFEFTDWTRDNHLRHGRYAGPGSPR